MPTIGKLKPSLRKRRIEMRLQRIPMELDFLNSLIGIRMRSERPSLGQTMQGQQVTFSCQTFLARLRLLIYRWSGELSLISMRISSVKENRKKQLDKNHKLNEQTNRPSKVDRSTWEKHAGAFPLLKKE
nr:hypothetical protein [Tanacetum cinerariifolium]